MDILHERWGFANESTMTTLSLDGEQECFALEDERRRTKVYGKTCIPVGRYELKLRTEGDKHTDYLARFPDFHKGMLWFQDVPGFTYVYYHIGNKDEQTLGCPLTGQIPIVLGDGEFEIARSEKAYVPFYKKVIAAMDRGERVFVEVKEREPHP